MDLPDGFIKGGQIEMGSLILRAIEKENKHETDNDRDLTLQVQKFSFINILSLGTRNYFQQPVSWRVNIGFDRFILEESDLFAHLDVAGGDCYDLNFGSMNTGLVYGLLETRLKTSGQFEENYQLSAGTQIGWLYQEQQWQVNAYASYFPSIAGEVFDYQDIALSLGSKLSTNLQLRLAANRQLISRHGQISNGDSLKVGINWYF